MRQPDHAWLCYDYFLCPRPPPSALLLGVSAMSDLSGPTPGDDTQSLES